MSKLVLNANGMIVKAAVEKAEDIVTVEETLSMAAHKGHANAIIRNIHKMVPVIEGVVLRAAQDKKTGKPYLYGERFYTEGSNNPNARALMEFASDFDTNEQAVIQLSHWDEDEKKLVPDHTVKCNDKTAKRLYVATKTHTLVVYAQLEKDLKKIYKSYSEKQLKNMKQKFVDEVETMGLRITKNNKVYVANKSVEGTHLTVLNWSPSNMRSETQLMTAIQPDDAFKIMDEVSGGALSQAMSGKLTVASLTKLSARLGILGAPSVEMAKAANEEFGYVIVLDEIKGPQDYNEETKEMLESNGIEIDDNTSDGGYCISVEMIQKSFAKLGRILSMEKALLFAAQTRANKYFTKVFGEAKTQKNMQFRLNRIIEMYGEDKVLFVEAGEDVTKLERYSEILKSNIVANNALPENERLSEKEILEKTLADLKKSYKAIVVGNRETLGCIIDYNGGKLLKNISLQKIVEGDVTTHLLDIAKCSETSTSGQMLAKFLIANKEATINALLECMADNFDAELENMLSGDVDAHKASLAQFMVRYVPNGVENTAALEALIKEMLPRLQSMIYKSKIDIKAYFQRALFDDTFFLTAGKVDSLLARNKWTGRLECYSRDVEVKFAKEIAEIKAREDLTLEQKDKATSELLTGVAFKYPSPSSDENAIVTYVTSEQLKARINAMYKAKQITRDERAILLDDFLNTSYGVTKLGADNTLKHKLAGMDTDYDGIAVVFEKKLVDILLTKYNNNDGLATIICK